MALITISEADASLDIEIFAAWHLLSNAQKTFYIDRASGYIVQNWRDDDIDWEDNTTIPSEVKDLIAQYADADSLGKLYSEAVTGVDSTAPIKKKTHKVGNLEQTIEYAQSNSSGGRYTLRDIDDQMLSLGLKKIGSKGTLLRT